MVPALDKTVTFPDGTCNGFGSVTPLLPERARFIPLTLPALTPLKLRVPGVLRIRDPTWLKVAVPADKLVELKTDMVPPDWFKTKPGSDWAPLCERTTFIVVPPGPTYSIDDGRVVVVLVMVPPGLAMVPPITRLPAAVLEGSNSILAACMASAA